MTFTGSTGDSVRAIKASFKHLDLKCNIWFKKGFLFVVCFLNPFPKLQLCFVTPNKDRWQIPATLNQSWGVFIYVMFYSHYFFLVCSPSFGLLCLVCRAAVICLVRLQAVGLASVLWLRKPAGMGKFRCDNQREFVLKEL